MFVIRAGIVLLWKRFLEALKNELLQPRAAAARLLLIADLRWLRVCAFSTLSQQGLLAAPNISLFCTASSVKAFTSAARHLYMKEFHTKGFSATVGPVEASTSFLFARLLSVGDFFGLLGWHKSGRRTSLLVTVPRENRGWFVCKSLIRPSRRF